MTTAHRLDDAAGKSGGLYRVRLAAEYQRSRTEAAAAASRLALLCRSPDATPSALEEAARASIEASGWLMRAAGLTVREE